MDAQLSEYQALLHSGSFFMKEGRTRAARKARKLTLLIALSICLSSCAVARLSKGPDTDALAQHENGTPMAIAKALDERESEEAGAIGAATINVKKSELVELISNYLIEYFNEKVGLNVERVEIEAQDSLKLAATKNKVNGVMVLKVKDLNIFSVDLLLEPAQVDLTLELRVFDESGNEIYRRTVMGRHEKLIGISMAERSAGKLVEAVVKDALNQFVKDSRLKKIIATFKHGAIAKIF